jgi:L-aminopeptidase/D-esterase-like protein
VLTDVPGVAVGHWTDPRARTGCTVVLFPDGSVASGEVRGGAPGTREWDLLAPERRVGHVDAVVLTGGSAFGLAACDGVARWCEEAGRGFPTRAAKVPIVIGAVLYDLGVGDAAVRPGPDEGYAACGAATTRRFRTGPVGAGAGASIGSWDVRGRRRARRGGIGTATVRHGDVVVSALFAVNAYGDILGPGAEPADVVDIGRLLEMPAAAPFQQTTIGVVATNARLDKTGCLLLAQSAHDGMARALEPVHTTVDGDAVVAVSVPGAPASVAPATAPAASAAPAGSAAPAVSVPGAPAASPAPPSGGAEGAGPTYRLDGLRAMAARATTAAIRGAVPPRRRR